MLFMKLRRHYYVFDSFWLLVGFVEITASTEFDTVWVAGACQILFYRTQNGVHIQYTNGTGGRYHGANEKNPSMH